MHYFWIVAKFDICACSLFLFMLLRFRVEKYEGLFSFISCFILNTECSINGFEVNVYSMWNIRNDLSVRIAAKL